MPTLLRDGNLGEHWNEGIDSIVIHSLFIDTVNALLWLAETLRVVKYPQPAFNTASH